MEQGSPGDEFPAVRRHGPEEAHANGNHAELPAGSQHGHGSRAEPGAGEAGHDAGRHLAGVDAVPFAGPQRHRDGAAGDVHEPQAEEVVERRVGEVTGGHPPQDGESVELLPDPEGRELRLQHRQILTHCHVLP